MWTVGSSVSYDSMMKMMKEGKAKEIYMPAFIAEGFSNSKIVLNHDEANLKFSFDYNPQNWINDDKDPDGFYNMSFYITLYDKNGHELEEIYTGPFFPQDCKDDLKGNLRKMHDMHAKKTEMIYLKKTNNTLDYNFKAANFKYTKSVSVHVESFTQSYTRKANIYVKKDRTVSCK